MLKIDLITALGRLLSDRALRVAYAADPASTLRHLNVAEGDWPGLINLNFNSLEFQAQVLLRKRFETVSRLLPQTCRNLGEDGWPAFMVCRCAFRSAERQQTAARDAQLFLDHLKTKKPEVICAHEKNRIHFLLNGRHIDLHLETIQLRGRARKCLQIFFRWKSFCYERALYLALPRAGEWPG